LGALRPFFLALPIVVAALLSHACGVSIRDTYEGEFFKGMTVSGGPVDGSPPCRREGSLWLCPTVSQLSLHLTITNAYPIPVKVACFMEDPDTVSKDMEDVPFHERAAQVAATVLEPEPGLKPADKDLPKTKLDLDFDAPQPGKYFLACITPASPENGLSLDLRIEE
jgi:hypothetical protein